MNIDPKAIKLHITYDEMVAQITPAVRGLKKEWEEAAADVERAKVVALYQSKADYYIELATECEAQGTSGDWYRGEASEAQDVVDTITGGEHIALNAFVGWRP